MALFFTTTKQKATPFICLFVKDYWYYLAKNHTCAGNYSSLLLNPQWKLELGPSNEKVNHLFLIWHPILILNQYIFLVLMCEEVGGLTNFIRFSPEVK